jgi:putative transposase
VERFLGLITDKAARGGSFGSVKELLGKIDHFVSQYNKHCKRLLWSATAHSILEKIERLASESAGQHTGLECQRALSGTQLL